METKKQNWTVRFFDKNGKLIDSHVIRDKTEDEARDEAIATAPLEAETWTVKDN
jgi:hypothetical protein